MSEWIEWNGGRDVYEVANQLGGYVGPDTDEKLAIFLLREAAVASDMADEIVRLRKEVHRLSKANGDKDE